MLKKDLKPGMIVRHKRYRECEPFDRRAVVVGYGWHNTDDPRRRAVRPGGNGVLICTGSDEQVKEVARWVETHTLASLDDLPERFRPLLVVPLSQLVEQNVWEAAREAKIAAAKAEKDARIATTRRRDAIKTALAQHGINAMTPGYGAISLRLDDAIKLMRLAGIEMQEER